MGLRLVALAALAIGLLVVLGSAGESLGYDFDAYRTAADRVLAGEALYDPTIDVAGGYGIYQYPPPFVLAILPLVLLPERSALAVWLTILIVAYVAGALILPVRRDVRWMIVLLGGLSWPMLYSVKLGQVGTVLFLLFAVGWRWMDRPIALGLSIAVGAIVKLQPILLLGWAAATRRWNAVGVGLLAIAVLSVVAAQVTSLGTWGDYVSLLRSVSEPVTTPHNFTPGAVAYQLGAPAGLATVLQWANVALVLLLVGLSWLRLGSVPSYLATIVGSQLVSPLLWAHYALLLLLPVAWLLERRRWWAILIPLATWLPLVLITPPVAYPIVFWVSLLALLGVGLRDRRGDTPASWLLAEGKGHRSPNEVPAEPAREAGST